MSCREHAIEQYEFRNKELRCAVQFGFTVPCTCCLHFFSVLIMAELTKSSDCMLFLDLTKKVMKCQCQCNAEIIEGLQFNWKTR